MTFLKRPLRLTIQTSLNLAQVGEFSFVLAVTGLLAGLISSEFYNEFLNIVRKIKRGGEGLQRLDIKSAKVLVIAISDSSACRHIVKMSKKQNTELFILARTRYAAEVDGLIRLGSNDVIPEELETYLEITSRVLAQY